MVALACSRNIWKDCRLGSNLGQLTADNVGPMLAEHNNSFTLFEQPIDCPRHNRRSGGPKLLKYCSVEMNNVRNPQAFGDSSHHSLAVAAAPVRQVNVQTVDLSPQPHESQTQQCVGEYELRFEEASLAARYQPIKMNM